MTSSRFPFLDRPRLWGVAVSHYQVEGGDECDWSEWERLGRTRGGECGSAVDSWNRYEADATLAALAGANSFRFSISWSRIEPRRGEFDESALKRYIQLIDRLLLLGLEPVVSLFHYTHPVWFHGETPWTSPSSVAAFTRFSRRCAEAFGHKVRLYTILNEPLVFALAGYLDGQIPPGIRDASLLGTVIDNLLAAHTSVAATIREINPAAAISVANNMMSFAPDRPWNPLDRWLSSRANAFYNEAILEAFATGRWNTSLPPWTRIRGRRDDLVGSLDAYGINYYSRLHFRCPGRDRWIGEFRYSDRSARGLTDNGWEIAASEMIPLLRKASHLGLPLLITENGIADQSDEKRQRFITEHVAAMNEAICQGLPIAGYFYWSLLDNFEWLEGYGPKFGLYAVDRESMIRTPRPSVALFRLLGARFLRQTGNTGIPPAARPESGRPR